MPETKSIRWAVGRRQYHARGVTVALTPKSLFSNNCELLTGETFLLEGLCS